MDVSTAEDGATTFLTVGWVWRKSDDLGNGILVFPGGRTEQVGEFIDGFYARRQNSQNSTTDSE